MLTPYLHKDAPLYAESVAATGLDPLEIGVSPFAGMEPVIDPTIPEDEVHFVNDKGETLAKIKVALEGPKKPVAKKAPAARKATKKAAAKKATPPIRKQGQ